MNRGTAALSEREKETLRLLLGGHDAKSIARSMGLSIHTVNERLRDARRKLGVSSGREAARLLNERERAAPDPLGDKPLGVAPVPHNPEEAPHPDQSRNGGRALFWFGGGMLIMSIILAAASLMTMLHAPAGMPTAEADPMPVAASEAPAASPAIAAANAWVALLDRQRWDESWATAGALFKAQMSKAQWASTIQPVRQPLGMLSSRAVQSAVPASSLPGVPAGEYRIVTFRTSFARKPDAIETVVLAREGAGWKVNGYFIR